MHPARPVRAVVPFTLTLPAIEGDEARQEVAELALAVALHTGDADDLAGAHLDREVVEQRHTVADEARPVDAQHDGACGAIGGDDRCGGLVALGPHRPVGGVTLVDEVDGTERGGARAQAHVAADHRLGEAGAVASTVRLRSTTRP